MRIDILSRNYYSSTNHFVGVKQVRITGIGSAKTAHEFPTATVVFVEYIHAVIKFIWDRIIFSYTHYIQLIRPGEGLIILLVSALRIFCRLTQFRRLLMALEWEWAKMGWIKQA
jgi:hypothetical protein